MPWKGNSKILEKQPATGIGEHRHLPFRERENISHQTGKENHPLKSALGGRGYVSYQKGMPNQTLLASMRASSVYVFFGIYHCPKGHYCWWINTYNASHMKILNCNDLTIPSVTPNLVYQPHWSVLADGNTFSPNVSVSNTSLNWEGYKGKVLNQSTRPWVEHVVPFHQGPKGIAISLWNLVYKCPMVGPGSKRLHNMFTYRWNPV